MDLAAIGKRSGALWKHTKSSKLLEEVNRIQNDPYLTCGALLPTHIAMLPYRFIVNCHIVILPYRSKEMGTLDLQIFGKVD